MCTSCFARLRPRYKRLVDDIFPATAEEGLVKNNMEKLIFYAVSSPEKLDRIGEYLYEKASRDINRKYYGYVKIAMEAMDQLLISCHAQSLNLFIESFLKMVQKLLECHDPSLQIHATHSFVRFSNIDEQTPSYHLRYDFFVSRFSSMCHDNNSKTHGLTNEIRLAGIKGLQGVIRKTVSDDLVENIWDPVHMNKIIPSLLYVIQRTAEENKVKGITEEETDQQDEESPPVLAEQCLRELCSSASFGHVKSLIHPVVRHLDLHDLWTSDTFAIECFQKIMFSIQPQYLHIVIEQLMVHLDKNLQSTIKTRISMAEVLLNVIGFVAGQSVGPTILEIVNALLMHIRASTMQQPQSTNEEYYQDILIKALAQFTARQPDYQKIEILTFIMSKVTLHSKDLPLTLYSNLKCLLMVARKCHSIHLSTLPHTFLASLLTACDVREQKVKLLAQNVLNTLLDKHGNMIQFLVPTGDIPWLKIKYDKCSRNGIIYLNRVASDIYENLLKLLQCSDNSTDNINSVYTTCALIALEFMSKMMLPDYYTFLINAQEVAVNGNEIPLRQKCQIHCIVIKLFLLTIHLHSLDSVKQYVEQIIKKRDETKCHCLLSPDKAEGLEDGNFSQDVFLDVTILTECMKNDGLDAEHVSSASYNAGRRSSTLARTNSWVNDASTSQSKSIFKLERNLWTSSPNMQNNDAAEDISFESMKKASMDSASRNKELDSLRCVELYNRFKNMPFKDLCDMLDEEVAEPVPNNLKDILSNLSPEDKSNLKTPEMETACCNLYPEVFVY